MLPEPADQHRTQPHVNAPRLSQSPEYASAYHAIRCLPDRTAPLATLTTDVLPAIITSYPVKTIRRASMERQTVSRHWSSGHLRRFLIEAFVTPSIQEDPIRNVLTHRWSFSMARLTQRPSLELSPAFAADGELQIVSETQSRTEERRVACLLSDNMGVQIGMSVRD